MIYSVETLAKAAKNYGYKTNIVTVGWKRGYLEIKDPVFRCKLGGIAFSRTMKISTIENTLKKIFGDEYPF